MPAAKHTRKNPREIAASIVESIAEKHVPDVFESIDIAGPGFINMRLNNDYLSRHIKTIASDKYFGLPHDNAEKTMIDYGGPNVAKALHVGHIRPFVIGDCMRRLFDFAGHETISDIHLGDWGLPYGMMISELELTYPDSPYFKEDYNGEEDDRIEITLDMLAEMYPRVAGICKEDEDRRDLARTTTAKLHHGHKGYYALLRKFIDVTIEDLKTMVDFMGFHFDLWRGEAYTQKDFDTVQKDLEEKGLIEESDGAQIIRVARESDKKEYPPLMWLTRYGAMNYATSDLITIYQRQQEFDPDRIVYVTDHRQSQYFEQVFRASDMAGYMPKEKLEHLGYGTLNGTDGKPFKSRDGGLQTLNGFIEIIADKAKERLREIGLDKELNEKDFEKTANQIAIAAIKFGDLSNQIRADYIFDIDRFVAFEGRTGPYLQYTAVRINTLLQKAEEANIKSGELVLDEKQKSLALLLGQFAESIEGAVNGRSPHILCDYLYQVAQSFNNFYQTVPVLKEEDKERRASYLRLAMRTRDVLRTGFRLIGIETPSRM